jgi:hypothetical protein
LSFQPFQCLKETFKFLKYSRAPTQPNVSFEEKYLTAIYPFKATRNDEIDLEPGDVLFIEAEYKDGWVFGVNKTKRKLGYFPKVFVKPMKEKPVDR